jgi:hypothetical protein
MQSIKAVLIALLLFVVLQKNVAQSADPLTYIPKQAQNVYVLNMPSIVSKMDVNAMKNLDFVKEFMDKANNEQVKSYLKNPVEAGLDILKPITMVISQVPDAPYQSVAVIVSLKSSEKLNALLTSNGMAFTQKDGLNIIESDTSMLAWNKEMFVVMSLKKKEDPMAALAKMGKTDSTETETAVVEVKPKLDPSVYFQNSEVNAKTEALRTLMRTPHDIYIYQTTDGASKGMKGMMASMMFGLKPTDLDGNVTTGWADFEKGRIYGETAQKMNDAMAQKFSSLGRAKPSVNWNNYINTAENKNPALVFSFSLNPLGIKQMISENEILKMGANKAATKGGNKFSMDDAMSAFGGDVFATASMNENGMDFLIGLSISDKKAVEKMLKQEKKLVKVTKDLYVMTPPKPVTTEDDIQPSIAPKKKTKTFILFRDNVVLIGKEAQIMALKAMPKLTGVLTTETSDWQKSLKNKPMNMFFNFKSIGESLGPLAQGKLDDIPFESISLSMFNKTTSFEIKMNDAEKNSLTAFFNFIDKTMKAKKEKEKKAKESQGNEEMPVEKKGDGN